MNDSITFHPSLLHPYCQRCSKARNRDTLYFQMKELSENSLASVVIVTWNRQEDLRQTLEKLRHNRYTPLEIIVVDNGSSDGTGEMVRAEFPEVIYLPQSVNRGIAAYNTGFKVAKGEYVVVLDSDSYPAPDAIANMVELFERHPGVGVVAFDVHSTEVAPAEWDAADAGNPDEMVGYHGAGAGIRRKLFETAGYWYEPFFLYFNEMDHALSILKEGWRIIHSPMVRAIHKSSRVSRPSTHGSYYYSRNAFWLVWRHYPFREMMKATIHLSYLAVSESLHQRTPVFIRAMRDAYLGLCGAVRDRSPMKKELFQRVRIPLPLVFTRWG